MFPKKILGITMGWKDLGKTEGNYKGNNIYEYNIHSYCNTILRIGKENGELFKFCPRCMIKIKKS